MSRIALACEDLLLIALAAGAIYDVVACIALWRWLRKPSQTIPEPLVAITFFRPIKRNVTGLRELLEAVVASSGAGDQILLGVDAGAAREEAICQEIIRAFPGRDIAMVPCVEGVAPNPKISKLMQMESQARHGGWFLSDSEVLFDPEFMRSFRAEWEATGCGVLTAAYRCVNVRSGPQCCDAAATLLGLWPGLALVRLFGRVSFTLGACTLLRREALIAAGGWAARGEALAEDYELGKALVGAGESVGLSRSVATLDSDPMSWRDYWRHQRRVALTYRVCQPAGFAGMVLTQAPVWGTAFGIASGCDRLFFLGLLGAVVARAARVQWMARRLKFPIKPLLPWAVVASIVEALCWILSWFTCSVWWGSRRWRIDFRGRLKAMRAD